MRLSLVRRFNELSWKRIQRFAVLFLDNLREHRRIMFIAASSGVGAVVMRLLRPWPVKVLFDGVLIPDSKLSDQPLFAWLLDKPVDVVVLVACVGLLVITLFWSAFSYAQAFLTARAGQLAVFSLRQRAYSHMLRLSLGFHQRRQHGDLVMRLTGDINLLRDMMVDSALLVTSEGIMLVSMVAVMLVMDVPLTLAALSILPLMALTTFRFSVRIRDAAQRQRKKEGRVAAMVSEMLSSVGVIQAFGRESDEERKFRNGNRTSLKAGLKTTRLEASMSRIVEVLLALGTAAVLWLGVHRVRAGILTPGDLLVFTSYLHSSYRPLRKLARASSRMAKAVVCADRVVELLESAPDIVEQPDAKKACDARGLLEFRRVSFDYPGRRRALHRLSFVAQPGQLIGIAGVSGAGKSTVLALMLRLYDPRKGKVLLDGRDIRRLRLQSLRDQFSPILQEPVIFGSTIRENIAFGDPSADDADIERAAKLANADEFICDLADGYDTSVAEAGASLSAGQRQRLSIARAFLRNSPILLMDEPTQGLDAAAEDEVAGALRRLMRGRTTILVAHKLELLRGADDILVLKGGRVRERGTHEELLEQDGWYSRCWALQHRGDAAARSSSRPSSRSDEKVVAFDRRSRKQDEHLRVRAAGSAGLSRQFNRALLDAAAVADALARVDARPRDAGPLRLSRAWPFPRAGLVALYEDLGDAERPRWWGIHAISGRAPGVYRQALRNGTAVDLQELDAIAHAFPNDPALIGLATMTRSRKAEPQLAPWLRQISEEWTHLRATVVGYKPTRRCVIRYRLEAEGGGRTLYAKCFRVGGADQVWKIHAALRRARRQDRLETLRTPVALGLVPGFETILWRRKSGILFADLLAQDQAAPAAPRIGMMLADLHRSSTDWRGDHGRDRELGTTSLWGLTTGAAFPEQRGDIEQSIERLGALADAASVADLVPSHRDFYDKQVLVDGDRTALLDLETACRAEPELDVANFLAHLELREAEGVAREVDGVAAGFIDAYSGRRRVPDPARLAFYRSSALLRLACVYALRAGEWTDLSASLMDRAEAAGQSKRKLVGQ